MTQRLRPLLLDVPLGFLIGIVSLGVARVAGETAASGSRQPPWMQPGGHPRMNFPPDVVLHEPYTTSALLWSVIIGIGIAARRIRPFTGYALTVVSTAGYLAVGLPFGPALFAPALGLLALATRLPVRRWLGWAVLLLPVIWAGFVTEPYLGFGDPNFYTAVILAPPLIMVPALIATIRRIRAEESRRSHADELRRAAYQERLRIARDVHDLIGHSLSVINMQAGVALYVLNKDQPAAADRRVEDSLQAIRSTSKNALDELRTTLAVFRGAATSANEDGSAVGDGSVGGDGSADGNGRAPVSGLGRLPELVESFRVAGRTVTVNIDGRLDDLHGPVDNAAYRIVQEALTNVARHAADSAATVMITRTPDRLVVEITDNGPGADPQQTQGSGLIGMRERARAVGGEVHAGPRPGGGFAVHAEFPLQTSGATR